MSISKETSSLGASHLQSGPLAKYDLTGRFFDVKPVSDLAGIIYPEGIKPNAPSYRKAAKMGYYKYDRNFLLQFMPVCKMRSTAISHRASTLNIEWVPDMVFSYGKAKGRSKLAKNAAQLDGRDVKDSPVHSHSEVGLGAQLDGREVVQSETGAQLDGRDVEYSGFSSKTGYANNVSATEVTKAVVGASTSMMGADPNALPISRSATEKPKPKTKHSSNNTAQIQKLKLKYKLL